MAEPAKRKATYDDLYSLPENMVGQIINGELIATPHPSRKHAFTTSALIAKVTAPYQFGEGGGTGGWIILVEPEIKLGENILVPDVAGWRTGRFPGGEETNWIAVCPDWVCEVLSPSTLRLDKVKKMPLYAQHGVHHLWFLDPVAKSLEVFRLESGRWVLAGVYTEEDKVRAEPFQEMELDLGNLWLEGLMQTAN